VIPDTEKRKKHILKNQLWGVDINPMMIRLANATFTLYIKDTTNLICANSLEYDIGMKFDVVIGNPPYQDLNNRNTQSLWILFLKKAFDIVQSKGFVSLITPRTWATSLKVYTEFFLKKDTYVLNLDECASHFPGIGSTFSYFIIRNDRPTPHPIKLITPSESIQLDSLPPLGLGRFTGNLNLRIWSKILRSPTFPVITSSGYNTSKFTSGDPSVSKEPTATHPYQILHKIRGGVAEYFYSSYLDPKEYQIPRVILSIWVANYRRMQVSKDLLTCESFRHFPTKTLVEAERLRKILLSPVYEYIALSLTSGGSFTNTSVSYFPALDLTHDWTNEQIYEHFNLTPEEIAYIESVVHNEST
jgi:hypothetical protein